MTDFIKYLNDKLMLVFFLRFEFVFSKTLFLVLTVPCNFYSIAAYLLGAFAKLRKTDISFVMFVCSSAWKNSASTGCIFMKFYILVVFENLS